MEARKDKKWPDVAAAMQSAIDIDQKESSTRKIGGGLFRQGDEYLPYFYLGEAQFEMGNCTAALTAWEQSDKQREARRIGKNGSVILAGYKQCEAKGFLLEARLTKEAGGERGLPGRERVYQEWQQDIKAHPGVPVDAAAQSNARAELTAANEKLASGQRTRRAQDFVEVRSLLGSAIELSGTGAR